LTTYGSPDDPLAMSSGMAGLIKDLRNSQEGVLINGDEKAAKTNILLKLQLNYGREIRRVKLFLLLKRQILK
jgi:hypothetical protein